MGGEVGGGLDKGDGRFGAVENLGVVDKEGFFVKGAVSTGKGKRKAGTGEFGGFFGGGGEDGFGAVASRDALGDGFPVAGKGRVGGVELRSVGLVLLFPCVQVPELGDGGEHLHRGSGHFAQGACGATDGAYVLRNGLAYICGRVADVARDGGKGLEEGGIDVIDGTANGLGGADAALHGVGDVVGDVVGGRVDTRFHCLGGAEVELSHALTGREEGGQQLFLRIVQIGHAIGYYEERALSFEGMGELMRKMGMRAGTK